MTDEAIKNGIRELVYEKGKFDKNRAILEKIQNKEFDNNNFKEAYFGEHLADKYEKITSSLNMISAISSITNKIQLSSLTTNLTFYNC